MPRVNFKLRDGQNVDANFNCAARQNSNVNLKFSSKASSGFNQNLAPGQSLCLN
nr:hypothetical protein [uncultured Campylobacter sp.]